jgi:hypothetical protein
VSVADDSDSFLIKSAALRTKRRRQSGTTTISISNIDLSSRTAAVSNAAENSATFPVSDRQIRSQFHKKILFLYFLDCIAMSRVCNARWKTALR